eukprot:COSAG03_NODE_5883_length_1156_cov_1.553453_1_plen_216_part_10
MLTRIWCLFELNAAIETGAVLKFVSTEVERQSLSLSLGGKFQQLGARVSAIDVRDCDAKRPHEIQDKQIFLAKIKDKDEVNRKLQKEMRTWLADAALDVIHRTHPERPALTAAEQATEAKAAGGARKTRVLEACPHLPAVLNIMGTLGLFAGAMAEMAVFLLLVGSDQRLLDEDEKMFRLFVAACVGIPLIIATVYVAHKLGQHQKSRQLRRPLLC